MKKKILTLILCTALAVASTITTNASDTTKPTHSKFVDLKTDVYIPENTLLEASYNFDPNHTGIVVYRNSATSLEETLDFKNCEKTPNTLNFTTTNRYLIEVNATGKPHQYASFSVSDCEAGVYKKVKIKLSDFSTYFTEDGKIVEEDWYGNKKIRDFNKKTNSNGTTYYDSFLVFKSGAAHTAVIPDKNGEVEFYLSTNPLHEIQTLCHLNGLKGILGPKRITIQFGDTNGSGYTDVNDVTQIQLALAGEVTLNDYGKFNADINLDETYDIKDATALQIALAKKKYW